MARWKPLISTLHRNERSISAVRSDNINIERDLFWRLGFVVYRRDASFYIRPRPPEENKHLSGKSGNSIGNSPEPFRRVRSEDEEATNGQTGAALSVNIVASRSGETCERMRRPSTEFLLPRARPIYVCYSVYRIRTGSLFVFNEYLRFTSGPETI